MKYSVIFFFLLVVFSSISMSSANAEEILILVENEVRKVYYTGENIVSVSFNHRSASVIFEDGGDARLEVKAPKVYKHFDPGLVVLRNGLEVDAIRESDECFYYLTFETEKSEKIEIVFAHWPEFPEVVENCETFAVSPLKQISLGASPKEVQCQKELVLITKSSDGSPACVKPETKQVLIERGWANQDEASSIHNRTSTGSLSSDRTVYPAFANGVTKIINPKHELLRYYTTIPVIDDTYLSKSVKQWNDLQREQLEAEHEKYPKDFYRELGRLLMKNEMQYQMNSLGIENTKDDFEVIGGLTLTSLPPHVGFSTVVYATDGHYYLLQGMTNANKVNYHSTTQLQYPKPLAEQPKIPDETEPKFTVMMKGDNDLKTKPPFVVLHQPGDVEFYNDTPETLTIHISKEGAPESEDTQEISADGGSGTTWTFTEPGSYSWRGEVPVLIDGKEYELNTGGAILVLADDMSGLSKGEQMDTARTILMASGLPLGGMGQKGQESTLYIHFDEAIEELLPESRQYYLQAAQRMIPFDIKLELD